MTEPSPGSASDFRFRRWIAAGLSLLGLLALLAAAAHSGPVRGHVRSWMISRLRTDLGLRVEVARLDYNLFALSATLHGVTVAAEESATPFFSAERIGVNLPWAVVRGARAVQSLEVDRPRMVIVRSDGGTNLPRSWSAAAPAGQSQPFGPISFGRLAIRDLELSYADRARRLSVDGSAVTVDLTHEQSGLSAGRLSMTGGVTVRAGEQQTRLSELQGQLAFDGSAVIVRALTVRAPETELRLAGTVDLLSATPRVDLQYGGRVDLGRLGPWLGMQPLPRGSVELAGRLQGPLGQPQATIEVSGSQLAWSGVSGMAIAARGTISTSGARLDSFRATLAGGEIDGDLQLPFGSDAPAHLRLRWRDLDVGALASAAGLPVRLASIASGTAALDWTGLEVLSARGTIEAGLRPSSSAGRALTLEGPVRLGVDARQWRLSIEQRLGGGTALSAQLSGRIEGSDFGASTLSGNATVQVADFSDAIRRLTAAGLTVPREQAQRLVARIDVGATLGGTLRAPRAEGTFEATGVRYDAFGPGEAQGSFDATADRLILDRVRLALGSNSAEAHAEIGFRANTLTAQVTGDFAQIEALAGALPPEWRPAGAARLHAQASGALDNPTVDLQVSSDDLRIAGQSFRQLRANAQLHNRVVRIDAFQLAQDEGSLTGTGRYEIATGRYAFDAAGAGLRIRPIPRGVPLTTPSTGAVPDSAAVEGNAIPIDAQFELRIAGEGTIESPRAQAAVQFSRLAWDRYQLGMGRIDVSVANGAARLVADLPSLPATLDVTAALDASRSFQASASLSNVALASLVNRAGPAGVGETAPAQFIGPQAISGAVNARLTADGRFDDLAGSNAALEMQLIDVVLNGLPVRLERPARMRYTAGVVAADDVSLRVGGASASVSGRLGQAGDVLIATVAGSLEDFVPLARLAPGLSAFDASGVVRSRIRAAGPLDAPDIEGELALEDASFNWEAQPSVGPVAGVTLRASYARGLVGLLAARAEWRGATVTASGEAPITLLGDRLPQSYRKSLPNLPDRAHLTARVSSLTQAALAPFLDEETLGEITGRVDATATVEATSLAIDGIDGELTLEQADLALARVPLNQVVPTRLRLSHGEVEVIASDWRGAGNQFSIAGGARLTGDTPQLALALTGTVDLRMLGAFSKDVVTAGLATLDVRVAGPVAAPAIDGQLSVAGGEVIVRNPRMAVTDLAGVVSLTKDRLQIRALTGNANGGTVRVSGDVQYPGFELVGGTVFITGRGLGLAMPRGFRTELDADLEVGLSQAAPSLTGRVTILRGRYLEPVSLTGQLLTGGVEALSASAAEANGSDFLSRTSLGVEVISAEDVVVDNNYGRLEIGSNLKVIGTVAAPVLAGRLTVQEGGQVFLGGRTYRVRRGTVDFTSATHIEPNFDLTLETRVQRYDITLRVSGTPEALEATLTSPGTSQADVISLLLTGNTATGSSAVAQTEIARGQLLMLLSGELLGFAGRAVGLDTVQVGRGLGGAASDFDLLATDTDPSARLTIGKNLSQNVEIVFSQSLRESGDITWIAMYRPLRNLEVRGTTKDNGSRSYEFRHDLEFGAVGAERQAAERTPRPAVRVAEVRIVGSPGFDPRELGRRLDLRAGSSFDFDRWQRDRERLEAFYHQRGFLEARIAVRRRESRGEDGRPTVVLEYEIARGPETRLVIEGYRLSDEVTDRMRAAWGQAVFDGFLVEDLEGLAKAQLFADGYLQGEVKASVVADPGRQVKAITLRLVPGARFDNRGMRFTGQSRLSADDLEAVVRAAGLERAAWQHPEELKVALERHYQRLGYLAATVTVDPPVFSADTATLPIRVVEGVPFLIAGVEVVGAGRKSEADVRAAFGIIAGSAYLPPRLEPARRAVEVAYLRDGYNDVRVSATTQIDREHARVNVALRIDEGAQQVVSGVEVVGAEVTGRGTINRALDFTIRKPADRTNAYRAQKRLYDTGVFRAAEVEFKPLEPADGSPVQPVQALVTLQELPRYRFRYGFRLNDEVGPAEAGRQVRPALVADLSRRNLFGRAMSTGVAGQIERDRKLARAMLSLPRVFGLPMTTSFFLTRSRETVQLAAKTPFVDDLSELTAEQRFRPANRVAVTYGYTFSRSRQFESKPNPDLPSFDVPPINIAKLTSTYAWDTRDDPVNPRTGLFQSSGIEMGTALLGSDLRFVRYLAQQYVFKSVGHGLVLASGARLGLARDLDYDDDLQPRDRFYAGGGTSIRGFAEDGVGKRDFLGDPTGGNSLFLVNQEVRFPVFKWVRGVGFFDAGNVFSRARDLSLTNLEAGVGVGVRIHSPYVLLRIDYGMPLTQRSREPFGRWYFGIGQTF